MVFRRRAKRGESTIIANLILFVAVMGMAGMVVFLFKNMLDEGANAASAEKERTVGVMQTSFTIPSAVYTSGNVYVYAKNTGTQSFDPNDMDIYIDGMRIPRDPSNRTVSVMTDTDVISTGVWDSNEELEFDVFTTYSVPATHTLAIYAPNGVKATAVFSS